MLTTSSFARNKLALSYKLPTALTTLIKKHIKSINAQECNKSTDVLVALMRGCMECNRTALEKELGFLKKYKDVFNIKLFFFLFCLILIFALTKTSNFYKNVHGVAEIIQNEYSNSNLKIVR